MNHSKYLLLFAAFALLVPASLFARDNNSGTMTLTEPAKIGSTVLKPGTYKVEWNGTGQNVQVNVLQGKKSLAEVQGELTTNKNTVSQDAVVLKPAADNSSEKQIAEIDFGHHNQALVIAVPSQAQMGQ